MLKTLESNNPWQKWTHLTRTVLLILGGFLGACVLAADLGLWGFVVVIFMLSSFLSDCYRKEIPEYHPTNWERRQKIARICRDVILGLTLGLLIAKHFGLWGFLVTPLFFIFIDRYAAKYRLAH